jgi:hypothetical protein
MPRDVSTQASAEITGSGLVQALLRRMAPTARDSFTPAQIAMLQEAAAAATFGRHPLDLRVTLPLMGREFYLVVLGGPEQRSDARRRAERQRYPVGKTANLLFLLGCAAACTVIGGIAFTSLFIFYLTNF